MNEIKQVGILGAGTMGHGIAHVAAQAGYTVVLYDVTLDAARRRASRRSTKNLDVGVEKKKVTPADRDAALARLSRDRHADGDGALPAGDRGHPREDGAQAEDLRELSELCAPDALLASNTSSLSLTEIAAAATHPSRVVGMHFFNPVHLMKLLEVVRASQTADETLAAAKAFGERIGKTLHRGEGLAGLRLARGSAWRWGWRRFAWWRRASPAPEDIDRAMELGYGHPMGPLKLGDLVGLDVRLAIAEYLYAETGQRQSSGRPSCSRSWCGPGSWARRPGAGFYTLLSGAARHRPSRVPRAPSPSARTCCSSGSRSAAWRSCSWRRTRARGRFVVIKRILPYLAEEAEFVAHVPRRGAHRRRSCTTRRHRAGVRAGQLEGSIYIAMEWVDGIDLRAHARSKEQERGGVVPAGHRGVARPRGCARGSTTPHHAPRRRRRGRSASSTATSARRT